MTFDEFLEKIDSLGIDFESVTRKKSYWDKSKREPCDPFINLEWETGGYSGGSCYSDSNPQPYVSDNREPEFEALDKILEAICPEISFLKYKNLASEVITYSDRTQGEYYGNSINYDIKTLHLKKLYESLDGRGLLSN